MDYRLLVDPPRMPIVPDENGYLIAADGARWIC
jgi:hypothetical protein